MHHMVQARRRHHHQHIEPHHPCRRCNVAHHACTISLEVGKFLECRSGSLSPLGVVRKQRWQATTDVFFGGTTTGPLETLCESHSHGGDIWLFVLTETVTERRLRHEQVLLMLRLWEITLEILMDAEDSVTQSGTEVVDIY